MPPAVGSAAAISAKTNERIPRYSQKYEQVSENQVILLNPPTMVQFAKAAFGPPVYITNLQSWC